MQKRITDSLPNFHICHFSASEYITWIALENILKYIENISQNTKSQWTKDTWIYTLSMMNVTVTKNFLKIMF